MRRVPYFDRNQKLSQKYTSQPNEKKSFFDLKVRPVIQSPEKNNLQPSTLLKKSNLYDNQEKSTRISPMLSRPVTNSHNHFQRNTSESSKNKNLRNNFFDQNTDEFLDKKIQLINQGKIKFKSNNKNKSNEAAELFLSSARTNKQQILSKPKVYRGNSFKETKNLKQASMSFNRKYTPTHSNRYERQKQAIKTSQLGINKFGQKNERIKDPENQTSKKLFDILERNYKPKNNIQKDKQEKNANNQPFFQYVLRFSYRSKKGFMPNNPGKCNQDSYIISPNINKKTWQHYFGICDGHGIYGHHVSSFIKNHLPVAISSVKNLQKNPKQNLYKSFEATVKKLVNDSHIDLSFSGSTVVGCYLLHDKIFCCNVGDSRSIIGSQVQKDKKWTAKCLSIDHKPSLQKQKQRIIRSQGRVEAFKDNEGNSIGPLRVWLKEENVPGLAMTRSFGDLVAASVGVSWQPQILQFQLTESDKIILIASDGVWQFLENEEIINHLSPFYEKNKIQQACDFLLELAHNTWTKQCSVIDDISFILIFMQYNNVE